MADNGMATQLEKSQARLSRLSTSTWVWHMSTGLLLPPPSADFTAGAHNTHMSAYIYTCTYTNVDSGLLMCCWRWWGVKQLNAPYILLRNACACPYRGRRVIMRRKMGQAVVKSLQHSACYALMCLFAVGSGTRRTCMQSVETRGWKRATSVPKSIWNIRADRSNCCLKQRQHHGKYVSTRRVSVNCLKLLSGIILKSVLSFQQY